MRFLLFCVIISLVMSFLNKIFGDGSSRYIKEIEPLIPKINSFEEAVSKLSDEELKNKTTEFKERLNPLAGGGGETLEDILPEAFACVREAAKRTLGERHFDVQLLGGIVMHGEASLRCGLEKVKRWWPLCRPISTLWKARECTW